MRPLELALLIGALVLAVLALAIAVVLRAVSKRRSDSIAPMFERVDGLTPSDEDRIARTELKAMRQTLRNKGRFYAFGALIAALFGTLAVRLWTLQVLSSDSYAQAATENMSSDSSVPAVRGRILDRNGVELAVSRPTVALSGKRTLADDRSLLHRLSLILGIPAGIIRKNLLDDSSGAQSDHVIATDVPARVVAYVKEHPTLFKGVNIDARTIRVYPFGPMAAHMIGYTGPVTQNDLDARVSSGQIAYEGGDIIGRDGAEAQFESILQGIRGNRRYKVDSSGNPTALESESAPVTGSDVCLTIDAALQEATDKILADTIEAARRNKHPYADAGAIVCIDIKDGGILAASSYPSFNPADLAGGISVDLWESYTRDGSGYPLTNRVISGLYPAASTFKAFTSMAGLHHGLINWDTVSYCEGRWTYYGEEWPQRCWIYPGGHGYLGLEEAIAQSCDVFFYYVGAAYFAQWYDLPADAKVDTFQDYVKTWGFGSRTGIDLPGEASGRIPDAKWKLETWLDTPEPAQWQGGDMTNMSIGQGDILVTPLQIANGYATLARQRAVKPHIFHKVIDKHGNTVVAHTPEDSPVQPEFDEAHRNRVVDGLMRVAYREHVFSDIPATLAGKSGTAEVVGKDEFAWFVAYGPVEDPQYCVACVIEQGGGGSSSAIQGVLHTFAAIYGVDVGEIIASADTGER
jgi:penicillin-binding protein 2